MWTQEGIRKSLEYVASYRVVVFLDPSVDVEKQMHDFPLQPGESWFPSIDLANRVYVWIDRPLMTPQQSAWLLERALKWEYV
jgi:hypothetical protein